MKGMILKYMNNRFEIVIDTLGSDKGPKAVILGASLILKEHNDVGVILVGDENLINEQINEKEQD